MARPNRNPQPENRDLIESLPDPDAATEAAYNTLPPDVRAALVKAGVEFPSETPAERRCRLKRDLDLLDDDDLTALLDKSYDTMARARVQGTGPVPIRVMRQVFYRKADVLAWLEQGRDVVAADGNRGKAA